MVLLWFFLFLILATLLISWLCFRMAFYATRKPDKEDISLPVGDIYEVYRDQMVAFIREARAMNWEPVEITSYDGLRLTGKYYEYAPGAPIELMFHGYRGKAERDLSGGVQRCFQLGRSALLVDQRACGDSDGHVITFGIKESRDCHDWVDFMIRKFGPDVKIILTGISMGATTVMMAAGSELPDNVVGVLADCGFTSARQIIQKVAKTMGFPPKLAYPFIRLGALLYGGFDPDADSAIAAMGRCKKPVIFFHGEADDFVPCSMSVDNYNACVAPKALVTIPGAGHGLGYLVDPQRYLEILAQFSREEYGIPCGIMQNSEFKIQN